MDQHIFNQDRFTQPQTSVMHQGQQFLHNDEDDIGVVVVGHPQQFQQPRLIHSVNPLHRLQRSDTGFLIIYSSCSFLSLGGGTSHGLPNHSLITLNVEPMPSADLQM